VCAATLTPHRAAGAGGASILVDDFESASAWSAHPADGVELAIGTDAGVHGRALRLDFRFVSGGGYAVARRNVHLDLPANYRFAFQIRGEAPAENLEFKLIDSTGENVWWRNRCDFAFPRDWRRLVTKRRQIEFAWGPLGGGEIRRVAAIEIAITAGSGGQGTVWLDDLVLEPLPPDTSGAFVPVARASSARPGAEPERAVDARRATAWRSRAGDRAPWLALDLGREREYGGLVVDWAPARHARHYAIETSSDGAGASWHLAREVRESNGGRDYIYLPENESRYVRLRVIDGLPAGGCAVRELTLKPLEWSLTPNAFIEAIARDAPRGLYPRAWTGEQTYWTIVGADRDENEALVSEDGAIEGGKGAFSVEPFLYVNGTLITWADVREEQWLEDGSLPIPSVRWRWHDLALVITVCGNGPPGASGVNVRYRLQNHGHARRDVTLFLALRPIQVNPPTQMLNTLGGYAPVQDVARERDRVRVNTDRVLYLHTPPSGFGAVTFDQGDITEYLRAGQLPRGTHVADSFAHASAALSYAYSLTPQDVRDVEISVPFVPQPRDVSSSNTTQAPPSVDEGIYSFERIQAGQRHAWHSLLDRVVVELPDSAAVVANTLKAQLAYILLTRDGAALQPGARAYERTWIRDGALMSSALLRLGHADVVREFIDWFARFQYPNGKVPCCVDRRGADPVPEHDSHGEFIYLVAEYYRYTHDRAVADSLWPHVARAAAYLDTLRQQRRTAEYRTTDNAPYFGVLPPSISHEGYSAKPMHAYWDDFFAARGFADAAYLAGMLGHDAERAQLAAIGDEFRRDLAASIAASMRAHAIDYVPGCADLGDFDATSTTIALTPVASAATVPEDALRRTFERYSQFFRDRRSGHLEWQDFTPYETRAIGAFVRLGWRERASELLDFFLAYRRPAGWAEWAEVVRRDVRTPGFVGDMPHTWVGSDFVRSVLDMLAYERDADSSLVLAAGVPLAWAQKAPGVTVRNLRTTYGPLSYTLRLAGDTMRISVAEGVRVPSGGVVVKPPLPASIRNAHVNGRTASISPDGEIVLRDLPAEVVLEPER
jgi:hypothetical protein